MWLRTELLSETLYRIISHTLKIGRTLVCHQLYQHHRALRTPVSINASHSLIWVFKLTAQGSAHIRQQKMHIMHIMTDSQRRSNSPGAYLYNTAIITPFSDTRRWWCCCSGFSQCEQTWLVPHPPAQGMADRHVCSDTPWNQEQESFPSYFHCLSWNTQQRRKKKAEQFLL